MILALDVGNTNIVFGCIGKEGVSFKCRVETDRNRTETEYAVIFKSILEIQSIDPAKLDGAIISSVVPPLNQVLSQAISWVTGHAPLLADIRANTGLTIAIDTPKQLGNDLIVDAVAALDAFAPPIIIFDMGTATTVSVLDQKGVYAGTVILPGLKISQEALSSRTSQLPFISFDAPPSIIGKNTIDAMKSGMIHGTAAMMDGLIDRLEKELGQKAQVIATGGLAKGVVGFCTHDIVYDDDLLLKGLWKIYQNQTK